MTHALPWDEEGGSTCTLRRPGSTKEGHETIGRYTYGLGAWRVTNRSGGQGFSVG